MGKVHTGVSRGGKRTKERKKPISEKSLIKIAPQFPFPPQLAKVQVGWIKYQPRA